MNHIPTTARFFHIIKKEIPLSLVAILSLAVTDNKASAYEVYDIITVENLNFPMEGFPCANGVFYDGTITADKCVLGNSVSYPKCNLIRSGTEYGIRQLNLADNMLCFNSSNTNKYDAGDSSNSVLYTTNYAAKLKSVTLLSGSSSQASWYLYAKTNNPFGPNESYGTAYNGKKTLESGKESTNSLSELASDTYKWFCITPISSPKLKYIQLCWIIDAVNPELSYYGPGMQSGKPYNIEYGSELTTLPEVRNPLRLELTYNSSNPEVATIDDKGNVNIKKIGQTIISANLKNPDGYGPSQARYLLNVQPPKPTLNILTAGVTAQEKEDGAFFLEYKNENVSSVKISLSTESEGATIWYQFKKYDPTVVPESSMHNISPAVFPVGNQSEYTKYDGTPIILQKGNDGDVTFFSEENGAKSKVQKIITGIPTGSMSLSATDSETAPEYFNLEGNRISHPETGIYIVRYRGTIKKIIR